MAESKNPSLPATFGNSTPTAERRDRAHSSFGNHPHLSFGSKSQKTSDGPAADPLPPKLQARMERLMADLAALDEPEVYEALPGDLVELAPGPLAAEDAPRAPALDAEVPTNVLALNPADLVQFQQSTPWVQEQAIEVPSEVSSADDRSMRIADQPSLAEVSTSFSRQAREILEILKRRQDELSLQKTELELREAGIEKRFRQERLALAERQRQLEQSLSLHQPASPPDSPSETPAEKSVPEVVVAATEDRPEALMETSSDDLTAARKITPEWIASHERLAGGSMANQDHNFYSVIEEYVARQVRQDAEQVGLMTAALAPAKVVPHSEPAAFPADHSRTPVSAEPSDSNGPKAWQTQAKQLRQQHETAVRSLQQTRRQLELLKDILAQQQSQWAKQVEHLDADRLQLHASDTAQQQHWLTGLEELERLRIIEQNESAKRKTFLDQREATLQALEERLQQSQVEILRDRVVLKQLERTVRQSMSNADWNQRWQVISEETQSYLKKVHEEAEATQSETKRKQERLESRKSEMLLYRESLRSWIERQMKLISRRVAHSDDREALIQQLSEEILTLRREMKTQQDALNELFGDSLRVVDRRLTSANLPNQEAA
jgi:hypothetical protein